MNNTRKRPKKKLAITSKSYLVKSLEGLRIDMNNHVYYMAQAQSDHPQLVNDTQKRELYELRNIAKRIERLEDRIRNVSLVRI